MNSRQRLKVDLRIQFHASIDLPVHVNGQIGYHQQRLLQIHNLDMRIKGILSSDHHPAGQRQRSVHPCAVNRTSINADIQLISRNLRIGLQLEAGLIRMRAHDTKIRLALLA